MLMLLDSAGLYFRAFYSTPESVTAPDGSPVNAVRGFLEMTATLVGARRPTHLVACWDDDWRPQWRVDLLPSYKTHRVAAEGGEDQPDALTPQVDVIVDVLAALGIARIGAPGYEADDILGTIARSSAAPEMPVEVVTGDRDLIQLVDDSRGIRVLYIGAGIRRMKILDEATVQASYGVQASQYVDFSILRGDPSDGLPGIPGIGEKSAASLLGKYGDLAGLRAAVNQGAPIRPAMATAIRDGSDYLDSAGEVVRVATAPLPEVDSQIPSAPANPLALAELVRRWGIETSVQRLQEAINQRGTST